MVVELYETEKSYVESLEILVKVSFSRYISSFYKITINHIYSFEVCLRRYITLDFIEALYLPILPIGVFINLQIRLRIVISISYGKMVFDNLLE